jgi:hypothetical protein
VFLYVWQRKDLQTARNEILARFSDVWQGKELAPKVMSGPSKIGVNEWPLSESARDKRENAMSRVRFQETAGGRERRAGRGQFWKREA